MGPKEWLRLAASILACESVGGLGTVFTFSSLTGWYAGLNKPWFTPPSWIFGPAWIALYALMGVSLYLAWPKAQGRNAVKPRILIFTVQLILNLLWSLLFFGLRSPLYGAVAIMALWIAIAMTILEFYKASRPAAFILIPYIIWVSFAALLNFYIFILN